MEIAVLESQTRWLPLQLLFCLPWIFFEFYCPLTAFWWPFRSLFIVKPFVCVWFFFCEKCFYRRDLVFCSIILYRAQLIPRFGPSQNFVYLHRNGFLCEGIDSIIVQFCTHALKYNFIGPGEIFWSYIWRPCICTIKG